MKTIDTFDIDHLKTPAVASNKGIEAVSSTNKKGEKKAAKDAKKAELKKGAAAAKVFSCTPEDRGV